MDELYDSHNDEFSVSKKNAETQRQPIHSVQRSVKMENASNFKSSNPLLGANKPKKAIPKSSSSVTPEVERSSTKIPLSESEMIAQSQASPPPPPRSSRRPHAPKTKHSSDIEADPQASSTSDIRENSVRKDFKTAVPLDAESTTTSKSPAKGSNDATTLPPPRSDAKAVGEAASQVTSKATEPSSKPEDVFVGGRNILQYALWAHYMAYGCSFLCMMFGIFAVLWMNAHTSGCKVNGKLINQVFLYDPLTGKCPSSFINSKGKQKFVCCDLAAGQEPVSILISPLWVGVLYICYGFSLIFIENVDFGFGLYYPRDSFFYMYRISPVAFAHLAVGIAGFWNISTILPGVCLIITAMVCCMAALRQECGDGGRGARRKQAEATRKKNADAGITASCTESLFQRYFGWCYPSTSDAEPVTSVLDYLKQNNPVTFMRRIYNEDKLSTYFWTLIFCAGNLCYFVIAFINWMGIISQMENQLLDGTLDIKCASRLCHVNRKAVRYGPISRFAPWAKACGGCLNLNCALLLLPVTKLLLRRLNNAGISFTVTQHSSDLLTKCLVRPLTRYIPLQKNIEFHKMCAIAIAFFTTGHVLCHYLNFITAYRPTVQLFRLWNWDWTYYFTGSVITVAMFIIYSAAPEAVRHAKFEIFFGAHHFFIVFFLLLFIHGPIYWYFGAFPVLLYCIEKILQSRRGNKPYYITKVEWIPPVMAVYFRPVFKEDFQFKEGQYLYLNCPHISLTEWHPFTISSASDDLNNGPRIHLETGEEVIEIPRPANEPGVKWRKRYCLASQDYEALHPNDYIDKGDTAYNDYVSVHIKVHGLDDPQSKSWTRKLKEYFESMNPHGKFPFYFSHRDHRGDISIGRRFGPDGLDILRVDGPHAAPAEHYCNYGTVMLIGAGIGLTPCASILSALAKYRWIKNFPPEILHFYWIVRQNEVDSFQWFVHMLTEISYDVLRSREASLIDRRYYCEINIYITGVGKKPLPVNPLARASRISAVNEKCKPLFTANQLYSMMLNPPAGSDSKNQIKRMTEAGTATNRLQDIWVWNGRPYWDDIFKKIALDREHSDIGVCFCGAPVIGADLKAMCEKYTNVQEDCVFNLHKENF